MGMAASQARYLGLTARKTNVEYEGQQVNQARTALANQSAGLFNRLLGLNVPTAPNTQDFTEVSYSYNDGVNKQTLSDITPLGTVDPNYNYTVTHSYPSTIYSGIEQSTQNPQVHGSYSGTPAVFTPSSVGNSPLTEIDFPEVSSLQNPAILPASGTPVSVSGYNLSPYNSTDANSLSQLVAMYPSSQLATDYAADPTRIHKYKNTVDGKTYFVCDTELTASQGGTPQGDLNVYYAGDATQYAAVNQILADVPSSQFATDFNATTPKGTNIYSYQSGGSTYYACLTDLKASFDSNGQLIDNQISMHNYYAATLDTMISKTEKASIQVDANGRFTNIILESGATKFNLSANTTTNEAAYHDAMNAYNYNTEVYQKTIEDINAKTAIIQQEDRTLELRLRQLDTEQQALSTEMEAVKKVIDKNIESTFKTFAN